jgi:hypothetical protein
MVAMATALIAPMVIIGWCRSGTRSKGLTAGGIGG